ncbi:MAG: hypothetical protein ACI85U_001996 [Candidatus Promineifilaceae bacterium]|jgi:hypothetical protein
MKNNMLFRATSFFVLSLLILQLTPFSPAHRLLATDGLSAMSEHASGPDEIFADCFSIFLPSISTGGQNRSGLSQSSNPRQALAGPDFSISSPAAGSTMSGMANFAVHPNIASGIKSVSFSAGATNLGTDSTASDGFQVYIDVSQFADGPLTLTATVESGCGQTSKNVNVNVLSNPPTNAILGEDGGTLASQIGSIITLPPGSVKNGTTVGITEKTQAEITAENGFEWDSFGVTFLGAQAITATQQIGAPAMVASAGYSNRVQPGQAVVNYRIMPDADGDGVDELVVVNTASVAGNDYVVSDPIPQIEVRAATSSRAGTVRVGQAPFADVQGPPGSIVAFDATGFNPFSPFGNLAVFESLVDSIVLTVTASIAPHPTDPGLQIVTTIIPLLPAGNAQLTLINLSTDTTFGPLDVIVDPPVINVSTPGSSTLEFLDALEASTNEAIDRIQDGIDSGNPPVEHAEDVIQDLRNSLDAVDSFRDHINDLQSSGDPAAADELRSYDSMADGSGYADSFDSTDLITDTLGDVFSDISTGYGLLGDFLSIASSLGYAVPPIGAALTVASVTYAVLASILRGESLACVLATAVVSAIPLSTLAGQILSSITGMGAVTPSGGPGCGALAPFGGGDLRAPDQAGTITDYTVIKLYSNGSRRPFSAVVDKGGYFYMPIIPEGEPFIALAINTKTGDTRTFSGVGPPIGESLFFKFDFSVEPKPIGTVIQVGSEISGTLNPDDPPLIFSITPEAGQEVFFESFESGSTSARWGLSNLVGIDIFSSSLNTDKGPYILAQSGQYLLTLTPEADDPVNYHFKIWDVPDPQSFTIAVGDTVTNSVPAAGAGNIESPAAMDVYTFNVDNDQDLFFEMIERNGITQIDWLLQSPNGATVFQKSVFSNNESVVHLDEGGTYTLTVGLDQDWGETGTYSFKIWDVPAPNKFAINVGDTVADGVPGAGAGNIETPGVQDIYTFNVDPNQELFFEMIERNGLTQTDWRLESSSGAVFQKSMFSGNQDVPNLVDSGVYTLTIGLDEDWGETGTYSFKVWDVPAPDQFVINIGDTVSNGVPGAGAGNIESPGRNDIYTFNATAGQQLQVNMLERNGLTQIDWQLSAPDDSVVFKSSLFSGNKGPFDISQTGVYTLTVGLDEDWGESGTYSFSVVIAP